MVKNSITHGQEYKIAQYAVENNVELSAANVYDTIIKVFQEDPILEHDGQEEHNITRSIARSVECDERTIKRINLKKEELQKNIEEEQRKKNIQKAIENSKPDSNKLVENLYKLNIVDGKDYLALVCFLMQLKYTREYDMENDDKTCVFFNGVARNGKSATAKAICAVETQYGEVFKAQSGKVLSSKHEEQVWKSHLNYFDEVKPTDIERELLLTVVNGGDVELDPKNKKPYNYHVNTNNIFTSNDQISLRQRRVSVIKFGNKLNGRPMKNETLTQIVVDIMNSLPDFARYDEIYAKVSGNNVTRYNHLAVQDVITYIRGKFGCPDATNNLCSREAIRFTTHDIFSCIKDIYNKQILTSERKEAIKDFIQDCVKNGKIESQKYASSSTTQYTITRENFLSIEEKFHVLNTKDEDNRKISQENLLNLLSPYFTEAKVEEDKILNDNAPSKKRAFEYHNYTEEELYSIDESLENKLNQLGLNDKKLSSEQISDIIDEYVTPGICRFPLKHIMEMFYKGIGKLSQENIDFIKERYKSYSTDVSAEEMQQDSQECDEFLQSILHDEANNNLPDIANDDSGKLYDDDGNKFLSKPAQISKEENESDNQTVAVANDNLLAMDDDFYDDIPF